MFKDSVLRLRCFFMPSEAWSQFDSIDILSSNYTIAHIYGRKISIKSKNYNMAYPSCAFLKLFNVCAYFESIPSTLSPTDSVSMATVHYEKRNKFIWYLGKYMLNTYGKGANMWACRFP